MLAGIDICKSLRPRGFNFYYYKKLWELLKRGVFCPFLLFTSKVQSPMKMGEFMLIYLLVSL